MVYNLLLLSYGYGIEISFIGLEYKILLAKCFFFFYVKSELLILLRFLLLHKNCVPPTQKAIMQNIGVYMLWLLLRSVSVRSLEKFVCSLFSESTNEEGKVTAHIACFKLMLCKVSKNN